MQCWEVFSFSFGVQVYRAPALLYHVSITPRRSADYCRRRPTAWRRLAQPSVTRMACGAAAPPRAMRAECATMRLMGRFFSLKIAVATAGAAAAGAVAASNPVLDGITTRHVDRDAYVQPLPSLDRRQLQAFQRGRKHFDKTWGAVTSLDFEWGLGPTFNATSCAECLVAGGRGRVPGGAPQVAGSGSPRIAFTVRSTKLEFTSPTPGRASTRSSRKREKCSRSATATCSR